jgi:hypothetical protein
MEDIIAAWLRRAPVYCAGYLVMHPIEGGDPIVRMLAKDLAKKIRAGSQEHTSDHSCAGSPAGLVEVGEGGHDAPSTDR